MVLIVLRALFILLMTAVGWAVVRDQNQVFGGATWLAVMFCLVLGTLVVCIDVLSPRRKLTVFAGTFLGLLVGILFAVALSKVTSLILDQISAFSYDANAWLAKKSMEGGATSYRDILAGFIDLMLGIICCYFAISFILQTKDDFRFIIPYVEFSKQTKGARPMLLDTSVLIDGRIQDIASTGVLESQLIVPRFVLDELQAVADSADKLKRNRGRRGLDVLAKLQQNPRVEVVLYNYIGRDDATTGVDQKLMEMAQDLSGRVLTNDFNLNKVAQLRGVSVININDLANALKPAALPGEQMTVRLVKAGESAGQAVGYLDDGTMIVVEHARNQIGQEIAFTVTSALQTSAGRMIFGRLAENAEPAGTGNPPRRPSAAS